MIQPWPASAIAVVVATVIAFAIWALLLGSLQRSRVPWAGLIAALVSWGCASFSLVSMIEVLRGAGW